MPNKDSYTKKHGSITLFCQPFVNQDENDTWIYCAPINGKSPRSIYGKLHSIFSKDANLKTIEIGYSRNDECSITYIKANSLLEQKNILRKLFHNDKEPLKADESMQKRILLVIKNAKTHPLKRSYFNNNEEPIVQTYSGDEQIELTDHIEVMSDYNWRNYDYDYDYYQEIFDQTYFKVNWIELDNHPEVMSDYDKQISDNRKRKREYDSTELNQQLKKPLQNFGLFNNQQSTTNNDNNVENQVRDCIQVDKYST